MPKRTSKRGSKGAIDRPFDPLILHRAESMVDDYSFVCGREPEGGFHCRWLDFPGVVGFADTQDAAISLARKLLCTTIAYELERGGSLPAPSVEGRRTEQLNVRLSAVEKLQLEAAAQQKGFRSVSDYVRAAALSRSA